MSDAESPRVPLILLLRISKKWREDLTPAELYQATRGWWVMSGSRTDQIERVLAVAGGRVREAYEPRRWVEPVESGRENRWEFEGSVASDRDHWVGRDLSAMFPTGAANPVRYVVAETMQPEPSVALSLSERVLPLLAGFDDDLLFAMSRSAQELFHTNTLAWLIDHVPAASEAILGALGTTPAEGLPPSVWREYRHLDLIVDPKGDELRLVVENKLFSVPSRRQLVEYTTTALPWSSHHDEMGAPRTGYVLLSLMKPAFDPPAPWVHVTYEEVADALADIEGPDADLVRRYCSLLSRLAGITEVIDPRFDPDEPFLDMADLRPVLANSPFNGPLQKMRYTGLTEMVKAAVGEPVDLEVGMFRGMGLASCYVPLSPTRTIGWQLQSNQLRLCMLLADEKLLGRGQQLAAERSNVASNQYPGWFDFTDVDHILGDRAQLPPGGTTGWNHFAPSFVYQYRKIDSTVSTAELVQVLARWTRRALAWPKE